MRKNRKFPLPLWFVLAGAAALVLSYFMQFVWYPNGMSYVADSADKVTTVSEIAPVSSVMISEIMTANKRALADDEGMYPDWIELYNSGKSDADISGWTLTDNAKSALKFTFPEGTTLGAGQCVLVYASKYLKNEAGQAFHAPFRLSAQGDALLLYDESGSIMESVNIPALGGDEVYARVNSTGAFEISQVYTPGLKNTRENFVSAGAQETAENAPLAITRLCADNQTGTRDEAGERPDWIEIANVSGAEVSLEGWALSDDPENPTKWRFPARTLAAGEKAIVFASGESRVLESGEMHAGFKLNAEGETVTLTDPDGKIASRAEYSLLGRDAIYENTGG